MLRSIFDASIATENCAGSTFTPAILPLASAIAKFMRASSEAEFVQSAPTIGITRRFEFSIKRFAQLIQLPGQRLRIIDVAVHRAHRARHHFERRLHLRPEVCRVPELGGVDHGPHHFEKIAVGFQERLRHLPNELFGRIVGDEANGKALRDEMGGGGMVGQNVEHLQPVAHAAAGGNSDAEHMLFAFVVDLVVEFKPAAAVWFANGPAGEAAGDFGYVLLGVAAIDAQRMQFHQLAAVVLIQALIGCGRSDRGAGPLDCQLSR